MSLKTKEGRAPMRLRNARLFDNEATNQQVES